MVTYLLNDHSSKADIIDTDKGTSGGNNEGYKFLQDLYEFNKTLPEDKKLTYLGVDIEHQTNLAIGYLGDIPLRNDIYENVKELIENFQQKKSNNELLAFLKYLHA